MRQAVKAEALRLGVDPTEFSLHSLRIGGACALRAAIGVYVEVDVCLPFGIASPLKLTLGSEARVTFVG